MTGSSWPYHLSSAVKSQETDVARYLQKEMIALKRYYVYFTVFVAFVVGLLDNKSVRIV